MFNILTYGFESICLGGLSALAISGALLFLSASRSRRGNPSPVAICAAILLFLFLSSQLTVVFAAIKYKNTALDIIDTVAIHVSGSASMAVGETVEQIIDQYPSVKHFLDFSAMDDLNRDNPISFVRSYTISKFNTYIWRGILWSGLFSILFGAPMFLPDRSGKGKKRRARSSRRYSEDFY